MLCTTPKTGRLVSFAGFVDRQALTLNRDALHRARERGASEMLDQILREHTRTWEDVMYGHTVTRYQISAVVMSEQEFKEAIEQAYAQGRADEVGRQNRRAALVSSRDTAPSSPFTSYADLVLPPIAAGDEKQNPDGTYSKAASL